MAYGWLSPLLFDEHARPTRANPPIAPAHGRDQAGFVVRATEQEQQARLFSLDVDTPSPPHPACAAADIETPRKLRHIISSIPRLLAARIRGLGAGFGLVWWAVSISTRGARPPQPQRAKFASSRALEARCERGFARLPRAALRASRTEHGRPLPRSGHAHAAFFGKGLSFLGFLNNTDF